MAGTILSEGHRQPHAVAPALDEAGLELGVEVVQQAQPLARAREADAVAGRARIADRVDDLHPRPAAAQLDGSVVAEVANNPGSTQRAVAAKLQVTDVTAGRLIDRLCVEGYLERHEDPEDRRAYRVYPTAAVEPLMAELGDLATQHSRDAFAGFDEADLNRLEAYLDAISRNVSNDRDKA